MPNRTIFLVRHGHYVNNATPPHEPDGPLSEKGAAQARFAAQHLQHYRIQVIHHSTLQRAVETADFIAQCFPDVARQSSPLLRECIPCIPTGLEAHFAHIPADFVAKGAQQAQDAFATYIAPLPADGDDQVEVVVSHGNLINFLASQTVGAPKEAWVNFDIQHCGITEISIASDGFVRLVRHNETGHLPVELLSFV